MTRVDLFKPSGKWKYTIEIDMTPFKEIPGVEAAFMMAFELHVKMVEERNSAYEGLVAVCVEPDHPNGFPITMPVHWVTDDSKPDYMHLTEATITCEHCGSHWLDVTDYNREQMKKHNNRPTLKASAFQMFPIKEG